jgi:hypothetical protein
VRKICMVAQKSFYYNLFYRLFKEIVLLLPGIVS